MAMGLVVPGGPLAVGMIVRTNIYCWQDNQLGITGISWRVGTIAGTPFMGSVALTVGNAIESPLAACMAPTANILGVRCSWVNPAPQVSAGVVTTTAVGTQGTTSLPAQISGILRLVSNAAAYRERGRMFVPFPAASLATSSGMPATGYTTALSALASAIMGISSVGTGGSTATVVPVLWNRASSAYFQVVSAVPSQLFGGQHRRGNYGRLNLPVIPL